MRIRLVIGVHRRAKIGATRSWRVLTTSQGDGTLNDVVKGSVTVHR